MRIAFENDGPKLGKSSLKSSFDFHQAAGKSNGKNTEVMNQALDK